MIERLENWARWARTHKVIPVSCKSLESRYRPPPCWHRPELKVEVNKLDAVEVEKGLIKMPKRERDIIVYSYLKSSYHFDAFCSKHKIRGDKHLNKSEAFQMAEDRAVVMLTTVMMDL